MNMAGEVVPGLYTSDDEMQHAQQESIATREAELASLRDARSKLQEIAATYNFTLHGETKADRVCSLYLVHK